MIAASLLLAGCGADDQIACTLLLTPGIRFDIRDSITGNMFTGPGTVFAAEGTFVDSLNFTSLPSRIGIPLVHERPGTYNVSVRAEGYDEWSKSNVTVTAGQCHVNTVSLNVLLQKDSTQFIASYSGGQGEFKSTSLVRVRLTAGQTQLDLGPADLGKRFNIPTLGKATVRFSLVSAASDTLGSGQVSFDLHPGWTFGVAGQVDSKRPVGVCTGPITPIALRSATGAAVTDTLYLGWLGLPRGAIC